MAILKAADVARYFVFRQQTAETAGPTTNLKIQKLCYYAQGFALARRGTPLFFDPVEHWRHGPVVPTLWRELSGFGAASVPFDPSLFDPGTYDSETRRLLDEVLAIYGSLSAWELRNKTNAESPWIDTPFGAPITHKKMRDYFEPLIEKAGDFDRREEQQPQGQELALMMMNDPVLGELTERGFADLAAGRYSTVEEVQTALGDV